MDRDLLGHLPIIICVARHRSFAAAAAELGMSPSAVSHAVRIVEDRLGTPLFARTTRSVALTEAGTRFIAGVEPALVDIGKAIEGLTAERGAVTGLLRINAPRVVLDMALIPILTTLARQHPRLTVEVTTDQISVDIVAQGFDAGIRIRRVHPARHGHDPVDWIIQGLFSSHRGIISMPEARRSRSPICINTTVLEYATSYPVRFSTGN